MLTNVGKNLRSFSNICLSLPRYIAAQIIVKDLCKKPEDLYFHILYRTSFSWKCIWI